MPLVPDSTDLFLKFVKTGEFSQTQPRFTPSESLEINLSASHSKIDKLGQPDYLIGASNPGLGYSVSKALIPEYDNQIHAGLFDKSGFVKSTSERLMARAAP